MNIVTLPKPRKADGVTRCNTKRNTKALQRQTYAASGIGLVAVSLAALSLSDLAHGVALVSPGSAGWQSWALAIGIDCGFISTEFVQLSIPEKLRKSISGYTKPLILGTMLGSAIMNACAFAASATGPWAYAAAALGMAIPGMIYALTRIAAAVYIDTHSRSN